MAIANGALQKMESDTGLAWKLLAWGHVVLSRGIARSRRARRMELLETLPLGGKRQLMLVVCDGLHYLVGTGGDGVHSIAEIRTHSVGKERTSAATEDSAERAYSPNLDEQDRACR